MADSTFIKSLNGRTIQDSDSIHLLTVNGTTITYTKGDGTTGTITTQDTITTVNTSGTGNVVTGISSSNGVLTITLGTVVSPGTTWGVLANKS